MILKNKTNIKTDIKIMIETYLLNYKKLKFILNEARQNDNDEDRLSYFISISVYITQIQLFMINSLINKSQPF